MLPVELEGPAVSRKENGAVPHAEPVQPLLLDVDRDQRGAAAAAEPVEHLLADGVGAAVEPAGDVLPLPLLEELEEPLRCPLAGGFAVLHAPHTVGHQGQQALTVPQFPLGRVDKGEGVLLPLPVSLALDVGQPQDRRALFRKDRRLDRLRGGRFFPGKQLKQSHPCPPR